MMSLIRGRRRRERRNGPAAPRCRSLFRAIETRVSRGKGVSISGHPSSHLEVGEADHDEGDDWKFRCMDKRIESFLEARWFLRDHLNVFLEDAFTVVWQLSHGAVHSIPSWCSAGQPGLLASQHGGPQSCAMRMKRFLFQSASSAAAGQSLFTGSFEFSFRSTLPQNNTPWIRRPVSRAVTCAHFGSLSPCANVLAAVRSAGSTPAFQNDSTKKKEDRRSDPLSKHISFFTMRSIAGAGFEPTTYGL